MPHARSGQISLYYEDTGAGPPVLFVHELASDLRQWRGQVEALAPRFRCIAYNARGYPPSDVPAGDAAYGWERFSADIGAVMDHLGLSSAILVGWSMGAYAALQFARLHPQRVRGLVVVGVGSGSGSPPAEQDGFRTQMRELAQAWEAEPAQAATSMAESVGRQPLKRRDPQAFAAWLADLEIHSPQGMALTCANYQGRRPSLEDFEAGFARLAAPVLLVLGEEDEPCIAATHWLAGVIPNAELVVLPGGGHAPMLEDPAGFNRLLESFLERL